MRMTGMALRVIRTDGFLALYNGLSASLCRQMTYSLTRFAIYETARDHLGRGNQGPPPFYQKVLLGAVGGCTGGFVGTPADMVNVRMQNDVKQPAHLRRNYSHALDGMYRVLREEGLKKLFSGATMASSRGALVTVGQLSCYDQAKQLVLATGLLSDNIFTHFLASFIAVSRAGRRARRAGPGLVRSWVQGPRLGLPELHAASRAPMKRGRAQRLPAWDWSQARHWTWPLPRHAGHTSTSRRVSSVGRSW
uniref:Solute carrier family 25 member 10 n=1 Tax=Dromaius novaehollandiae TaxID=8790 RepID=A0A8C4P215_DRONO